jgi:DNA-binding NtrC family response regulator
MKPSDSPLKGKVILVADDEPDILETVEEALSMCLIHKAADYDTAFEYLLSYTYDIVILDIMGINGLELLKQSVSRGFPTVMLSAHAFSPEFLKKSIKLGAVCFLPKEEISNLRSFLEDVLSGGGRPVWQKLFDKQFGPDWKEKEKFLKEVKEELLRDTNPPDTRSSSF